MNEPRVFEREELIGIRERAIACAKGDGSNETWVRAFWALADAANCLDAMTARMEIKLGKPSQASDNIKMPPPNLPQGA